MNPPQWPGYSENVQGYTSPGYDMYGSTPQFTDGAPQQGGEAQGPQFATQPLNGPIMRSPEGQPVIAVMPQQGFDVGSAIGGQPVYMQQQASPFMSFMPGPVWFTDGAAPATNAVQAGIFGPRR